MFYFYSLYMYRDSMYTSDLNYGLFFITYVGTFKKKNDSKVQNFSWN